MANTTKGINSELLSIYNASIGNLGGVYVADTNEQTPNTGYVFNAIQVITEAVITCVGNVTGITAITIPAQTILYGKYTSFTLASGSVIAYQGDE